MSEPGTLYIVLLPVGQSVDAEAVALAEEEDWVVDGETVGDGTVEMAPDEDAIGVL